MTVHHLCQATPDDAAVIIAMLVEAWRDHGDNEEAHHQRKTRAMQNVQGLVQKAFDLGMAEAQKNQDNK